MSERFDAPETAAQPTMAAPGEPADRATAAEAERAGATAVRVRRPARIGTIVWGFLVTAFAVVVALANDLVDIADPTAWVIGGLVVGGAALIAAGIAASLRRSS